MKARGKWQGMLAIARFNWPFYAAAVVVSVMAIVGLCFGPVLVKVACGMALLGASYFLIGSLGVSHLVYDRSDLYRFGWLERAIGAGKGRAMLVCHSGFDEVSAALAARFPEEHWMALDHFDEARMTEPSIRRARKLYPPVGGTLAARYDKWPLPDASHDVVFGLLAIHELRSEDERAAWFAEARRCLRPGGRVVLAEHLRDLANFTAFGPGFLHFHSKAGWRRAWTRAGLREVDHFRVTPWVVIFILTP
jgi:SAM-dependent methyltransferase